MFVKVYIHPSKVSNLYANKSVIASQMPTSQYEVELFIDLNKFNVVSMASGIFIKKKTLLERLLHKKEK